MTALVWFRRDLRVGDHPALRAALERHDRVVPVFCFDERLREPWRMPAELQRGVGCVMGERYPEPIVDHAEARRAALDRYRVG